MSWRKNCGGSATVQSPMRGYGLQFAPNCGCHIRGSGAWRKASFGCRIVMSRSVGPCFSTRECCLASIACIPRQSHGTTLINRKTSCRHHRRPALPGAHVPTRLLAASRRSVIRSSHSEGAKPRRIQERDPKRSFSGGGSRLYRDILGTACDESNSTWFRSHVFFR